MKHESRGRERERESEKERERQGEESGRGEGDKSSASAMKKKKDKRVKKPETNILRHASLRGESPPSSSGAHGGVGTATTRQ